MSGAEHCEPITHMVLYAVLLHSSSGPRNAWSTLSVLTRSRWSRDSDVHAQDGVKQLFHVCLCGLLFFIIQPAGALLISKNTFTLQLTRFSTQCYSAIQCSNAAKASRAAQLSGNSTIAHLNPAEPTTSVGWPCTYM